MLLSPLAPAFTPSKPEFAIYNDGVPCMISAGERGEVEIIAGLSDEVLDIIFPLTAEDAAELEECDSFVETLATLSILEDQETLFRQRFHDFHVKRWEARREEGLIGRPHPKRNTIKPKIHRNLKMGREDETNIVSFAHSLKQKERLSLKKLNKAENKSLKAQKKMKSFVSNTRPIIQPRKQN